MRRPAVPVSLAFAAGIGFAFLGNTGKPVLLSALGLAMVFLCWSLYDKRQSERVRFVGLFLVLFFLGALLFQIEDGKKSSLEDLEGTVTPLEGVVETAEKREEESYRVLLKTPEERVLVNLYGELEGYSKLVGRQVTVIGELSVPAGRKNPNTFDYALYLKTKGVRTVMTAQTAHLTVGECQQPVRNGLSQWKGRFTEQLYQRMPSENAALVCGMMFGDKNGIEDELYESFQRNGTAHILAVSGLHIGIIYGCINRLFGGRKRLTFDLLSIVLLVAYGAMAAFAPSVVRACTMIFLHILARLLHRPYDMLTAASVTAMGALLLNPFILFNTGFQLSYLAIFALAVFLPAVKRGYEGVFTATIAIQAGMIPVTAYLFNYFSLAAFLANFPVLFLGGVMLPMGMGLLIAWQIPLPESLVALSAACLEVVCAALIYVNQWMYMKGAFAFHTVSPDVFWLGLYYGGLFVFLSEAAGIWRLRKQWKKALCAGLIVVLLSGVLSLVFERRDVLRDADLVFVDVGQGDCLHIRTEDGKNILIDGGGSTNYNVGKKTLLPYLLKNGVKKVDLAFVTHLHGDHYNGLRELAQAGIEFGGICVYEGNRGRLPELAADLNLNPEQVAFLRAQQQIKLSDSIYVEVVWPKAPEQVVQQPVKEEDENASCLVLRVNVDGVRVLMTGDIDQNGENSLVDWAGESALQSDILKVAHHGSKYSSSEVFVNAVSPAAAVIQVGKNNFGHPAPSVIEIYEKKGIMVYRNDLQGAIGIFREEKGRVSVRSLIEQKEINFRN